MCNDWQVSFDVYCKTPLDLKSVKVKNTCIVEFRKQTISFFPPHNYVRKTERALDTALIEVKNLRV